ncbi:uncharacterized protein LOC143281456 [Babylonia areolata]|uniref:uncharacterized protein LOC143281456 n=1 Tax=Babylonia areolata TaxID=304850 RepID=UPI003FD41E10
MTKDYERFIRSCEYIADIIAQWESSGRLPCLQTRVDWHGGRPQRMTIGGQDAMFLFRKRVYRHVDDLSCDPVERHLLYAEAVHKVVKLDEYHVTEETAVKLAGLEAYVIWGPFEDNKLFRYGEAEQYLCRRILTAADKDWPQLLAKAHQAVGVDMTEGEVKLQYLRCLQQCCPLYGCLLFPVRQWGLWTHPPSTLVAVNMDGVKFVNSQDKSIHHDFHYGRLESISLDLEDPDVLQLEVRKERGAEVGGQCVQKTFLFQSRDCQDLLHLLHHYCPPHLPHPLPQPGPEGATQMQDLEQQELCDRLAQCRTMLASTPLIQTPSPNSGGGFLWNTFRRLGKRRTDKERSVASAGAEAEDRKLGADFWSCSRTPLRQALTVLPDPRLQDTALSVSSSILFYCDVHNSGYGSEQMTLLQTIAQKSLDNDTLCDECYLQLVKQTTGQPDASSPVSLRTWQMLAVLCVTVTPANPHVARYVRLHLRKCAVSTASQHGKFAHFALRTTDQCLGTIQGRVRSITSITRCGSVMREWVGDSLSLKSQTHMGLQAGKSLRQTVYFLTGDHCEVQLDSAATCQEVIGKVKVKVGMRSDAAGFALYEVTTSGGEQTSRAMAGDSRLCDVIYRWERAARQGTGLECRLDFKKRLFLEPYVSPQDPVECEMVCHQLIQDVFEERVPLTPEHATQLCALKIQAEMRSLSTADVDYSSVMRILPRAMRGKVRVEEVERGQRQNQHLTAHQALVAFLAVLRHWALFGATLFPVSQNSTTTLPKDMLMAVHEHGVSLLELQSLKSLSSHALSEVQQGGGVTKTVVIQPVSTGTKAARVTCHSSQASQIVQLVRDYAEEVETRVKRSSPHS